VLGELDGVEPTRDALRTAVDVEIRGADPGRVG
jgi:hypothetical protein